MRKERLAAILVLFTSISIAPAQTRPASAPAGDDRDAQRLRLQDTSVQFTARKHKLQARIGENEVALTEMRTRLYIDGGSLSGQNPLEIKLLQFADEKFRLERAATRAHDRYETLTKVLKEGQTPGEIEDYLDKHPRLVAMHAQFDKYDDDLRRLTIKLGPKDETILKTKAQRDALANTLIDTEANLRTKAVVRLVDEARQAKEDTARDLKDISGRLETLKRDAGDLATEMDAYFVLDKETQAFREQLKQINDKLDTISVELLRPQN